jgi:SAM-dependent methyltransferase
MAAIAWIDQTFYPKAEKNWDDTLFRERILSVMRPDNVVLDLGAGAGIIPAMNFKGRAARVCGVDLDPRVESNPMLDEGRICDAATIPYPDATFDIVFSDNVLEHLAEPRLVFAEVARVLRPGGIFMAKTPNKWHYVPAIARLTPHRFHVLANRWRGRVSDDVFPTLYRANSKRQVARLAREVGLDVVRIDRLESRPEYLRFSAPTYLAGLAYERLVNASRVLEPLRIVLFCDLKRPEA